MSVFVSRAVTAAEWLQRQLLIYVSTQSCHLSYQLIRHSMAATPRHRPITPSFHRARPTTLPRPPIRCVRQQIALLMTARTTRLAANDRHTRTNSCWRPRPLRLNYTLAIYDSLPLVIFKAKFHYASWFGAGSKLV